MGGWGRMGQFRAMGLGTHKGCPYGGMGQDGAIQGYGLGHPQGVPLRGDGRLAHLLWLLGLDQVVAGCEGELAL